MEKTQQRLSGIRIVSIVGRQGSGKTTVAKLLASHYMCPHIECSTVVRNLCGDLPREEMHKTNARTATEPTWLGDAVADEIEKQILEYDLQYPHLTREVIIISGAREVEVVDTLRTLGADVLQLAVTTWTPARYRRLKELGKVKGLEDFRKADKTESKIGLDKLLSITPMVDNSYQTSWTVTNLVSRIERWLMWT